jgi:hypothetical protein
MLSSGFVFSKEVCFRGLYQIDLAKLMGKKVAYGQCIDLKKHFFNSLHFAKKKGVALKESIHECRSEKDAREFCSKNKEISLCKSLDDYLLVIEENVMKNTTLPPHSMNRLIVEQVSRAEFAIPLAFAKGIENLNKEKSSGNCLFDKEFAIAAKYSEAVIEKFKGDNGIGSKVLDKYDSALDDDGSNLDLSFFEELKIDCNAEITEIRLVLFKRYTELIKDDCLGELSQKGLSIYDKDKVYCSGETPLACTLFKRAPSSIK